MMFVKKSYFLLLLATAFFTLQLTAQNKKQPTQGQAPAQTDSTATAKKNNGYKPFAEIIPASAIAVKGMFNTYQANDKCYFEIPDSLLHHEILVATRLAKSPAGTFAKFPGEVVNSKTIEFEKGPSNNLFLRVVTFVNEADSNDAISKAVKNASVDPIVFSFDIKTLSTNGKGYVIDVTDFFKNENVITGFSANAKSQMRLGGIAADRSYLISMHTYP